MKKRHYHQNCALARATDLLGERWTLLIIRELLIQPCRFKQLNVYLAGMGTNLLAQRLKELESNEFVEKEDTEDKRSAYQLTELGKSLEPVILSIVSWGIAHTTEEKDGSHFHHWDLLAMKSLFTIEKCTEKMAMQFTSLQLEGWCIVDPEAGCSIGIGKLAPRTVTVSYEGTVLDLYTELLSKKKLSSTALKKFSRCFTVG